ncbi:hypothetical protein EC880221_4212, partial [Escherichia coli 88.0221]
SAGCNASGTSR